MREMRKDLKPTKSKTAPGLDKWLTLKIAGRIGDRRLSLIFSAWWGDNAIPAEQKDCRTILLFKKGLRTDVGNCHPITIGSILLRLYAKVWDQRLRKMVSISSRQKAFVPLDRAYENTTLFAQAIKTYRMRRKDHCMMFLDLAKAFDKLPTDIVDHILSTYSGAMTTISQNGKSTRKISINSGVKQGCPLSPLLFNLIMDELLSEIDQLNIRIELKEAVRLAIMAFVDDLILLTETEMEMKILLDKCKEFFLAQRTKIECLKMAHSLC